MQTFAQVLPLAVRCCPLARGVALELVIRTPFAVLLPDLVRISFAQVLPPARRRQAVKCCPLPVVLPLARGVAPCPWHGRCPWCGPRAGDPHPVRRVAARSGVQAFAQVLPLARGVAAARGVAPCPWCCPLPVVWPLARGMAAARGVALELVIRTPFAVLLPDLACRHSPRCCPLPVVWPLPVVLPLARGADLELVIRTPFAVLLPDLACRHSPRCCRWP